MRWACCVQAAGGCHVRPATSGTPVSSAPPASAIARARTTNPARIGNVRGASVRELAGEALKISAHGLARRARLNRHGADESMFLDILAQIVDANQRCAFRWASQHGPIGNR